MYEPRGAASDSDRLRDDGLPTPRHPSKRLQVLGASEVSGLPPSDNLGGWTRVSESDLDGEGEDDSQGVCQNYRNTPPVASRSIVVRAGESSSPLPRPKTSLCPLYSALSAPF
ncbi:hypothetical protein DL764_008078 [Monosporascus ibericus]|uniref:Uncharacterized protein n=1 Tax=Monosporascus ibericus TaxID=155417 RepID=A0A4Q4SYE4_9PEZI|nr:hypothetical protein DL764_008078 [Monosporascus ibericus]